MVVARRELIAPEATSLDIGSRAEDDAAKLLKSRSTFRNNLDSQMAEMATIERRRRALEVRDAAEMKIMNTQHLCAEMISLGTRRKMLEDTAHFNLDQTRAHERRLATERAQNVDWGSQAIGDAQAASDRREAAAKQRLAEKQAQLKACEDSYLRTAGRDLQERHLEVERRLASDELMHNLRMDTFYAMREEARKRQKERSMRELEEQLRDKEATRLANKCDPEDERAQLRQLARENVEAELKKVTDRKMAAKQLQQEWLAAIDDKNSRESRFSVRRPSALVTMAKGDTESQHLMRSVNASRDLVKPMGKPVEQVGPVRSFSVPSVTTAESRSHPWAPVSDDHKVNWKKGLTQKELRAGVAVARLRHARAAMQTSDVV